MTDTTLDSIAEQLTRMLDELRALRQEQRRLSENEMLTTRAINAVRDDVELVIRTEIGSLFAQLERHIVNAMKEQKES